MTYLTDEPAPMSLVSPGDHWNDALIVKVKTWHPDGRETLELQIVSKAAWDERAKRWSARAIDRGDLP